MGYKHREYIGISVLEHRVGRLITLYLRLSAWSSPYSMKAIERLFLRRLVFKTPTLALLCVLLYSLLQSLHIGDKPSLEALRTAKHKTCLVKPHLVQVLDCMARHPLQM